MLKFISEVMAYLMGFKIKFSYCYKQNEEEYVDFLRDIKENRVFIDYVRIMGSFGFGQVSASHVNILQSILFAFFCLSSGYWALQLF